MTNRSETGSDEADSSLGHPKTWPLLLVGILVGLGGLLCLVLASAMATVLMLGRRTEILASLTVLLISGLLAMASGFLLIVTDLFLLLPFKRRRRLVPFDPVPNRELTVVLTAWNDQASIEKAVQDFQGHPAVRRVLVVDNDSTDATRRVASEAGAQVLLEPRRGYGWCVYRALTEGAQQTDTELTLLCEGDRTFRAFDIDKFLAYIPHAEIVSGTRIVEELRDRDTQLTTFMFYGNFVVSKLLEAKYLGQGTFSDVGTTYKLCRNAALRRLLPKLDPQVGLAFNAYFLDSALRSRVSIVECPITFHKRVGVSKGGNVSNVRALAVGLRMIKGILFGW